jgi:hypothetical protein
MPNWRTRFRTATKPSLDLRLTRSRAGLFDLVGDREGDLPLCHLGVEDLVVEQGCGSGVEKDASPCLLDHPVVLGWELPEGTFSYWRPQQSQLLAAPAIARLVTGKTPSGPTRRARYGPSWTASIQVGTSDGWS